MGEESVHVIKASSYGLITHLASGHSERWKRS